MPDPIRDQLPSEDSPPIKLDSLFNAELANALRLATKYLPINDQVRASAYIAGISGLLKLGTSVMGHRATNFVVPVNLYMALVGDSGSKKSPIQKVLLEKPASDIIKRLQEEDNIIEEEWKIRNMGRRKSDREPEPIRASIRVQKWTPASLEQRLMAHEKRGLPLMVLKDEMGGLFSNMRSASGEKTQQLLESYDGSGSFTLRVSTATRHYDRCHMSIYGAVQPGLLQNFLRDGDVTGSWARFLFCRMPEMAMSLPMNLPEEEQRSIDNAHKTLKDYANRIYDLEPRTYPLCKEAVNVFCDYELAQQNACLESHLAAQKALCGKKGGKVLRVAGLLHLLNNVTSGSVPDTISVKSLQSAIDFVEELDAWAYAVHAIVADEKRGGFSDLMRKIHDVSVAEGGPVSWTTVQNKMSKQERFGLSRESAVTAMKKLAETQLGIVIPGRRGSLQYQASR